MVSVKQQAQKVIERLPDDVTWEPLQYHLYTRQKVELSRGEIAEQRTLSQDDVEVEMRKWLTRFDGRR